MRAVLTHVPESLLKDRARTGADLFDEMWEGTLHMNPPPNSRHQRLAFNLGNALHAAAAARGLVVLPEAGLYRPGTDDDWRVPDLMVAREEHISERGVEGLAELVIEILSPDDESHAVDSRVRSLVPGFSSISDSSGWIPRAVGRAVAPTKAFEALYDPGPAFLGRNATRVLQKNSRI
jgi:hypothetical protein